MHGISQKSTNNVRRKYDRKNDKIIWKTILEKFLQEESDYLEYEGLSNEERQLVHQLCSEFGLTSKSVGSPGNRILTIRKKNDIQRHVITKDAQEIKLNYDQLSMIKDITDCRPIELNETEKHLHNECNESRKNLLNKIVTNESTTKMVPPPAKCSSSMERIRKTLPAREKKELILNTIHDNRVTLITGGTGCGKTTQVPQFILEDAFSNNKAIKVICTQPRRLPAVAVAERVAKERGEVLGDTVGYHIRLEQKTSKKTILTYVTSGVLLRQLDQLGGSLTHVILDEIHERETNTDYLLATLKLLLEKSLNLKIILMSATMESNLNLFMKYFNNVQVAHVDIPARLYHVEKIFLSRILWMTGFKRQNLDIGIFNYGGSVEQSSTFSMDNQSQRCNSYTRSDNSFNFYRRNQEYDHFNANNMLMNNQQNFDRHGGAGNVSMWRSMQKSNRYQSNNFNEFPYQKNYFDEFDYKSTSKLNINDYEITNQYYSGLGVNDPSYVDLDLALHVLKYCFLSPIEGSILVFLPGSEEINNLKDMIEDDFRGLPIIPCIYILHSQMNCSDQHKVFDSVGRGRRKIILSTNIAEASITIDDVVFVIDSGKVKEKTYDPVSRISQLKTQFVAKSNAEQRAGRAGRCKNGYCIRLFSKEDYHGMSDCQVAEMKRSAIHNVCLHAKMFAPNGMSVNKFLSLAPEPPSIVSIQNSMNYLEELGALYNERKVTRRQFCDPETVRETGNIRISYDNSQDDEEEGELTELGYIMAELPVDPPLARLLIFGLAFKCFNPILSLVACLSHREPFIIPLPCDRDRAQRAKDQFGGEELSDHLLLIRLFFQFESECLQYQHEFCKKNFINYNTMKMISGIKKQLLIELRRFHLIPHDMIYSDDIRVNQFSTSWPLIQGIIVAGSFPGIGCSDVGTNVKKIRTDAKNNVVLHQSSVVRKQLIRSESYRTDVEYLAFFELSKVDHRLYARTVTAVPPLQTILFSGPLRLAPHNINLLMEDELDQKRINEEKERDLHPYNRRIEHPEMKNKTTAILSLETWLEFVGNRSVLKDILKLRFRMMEYLLKFLKHPLRPLDKFDDFFLRKLENILQSECERLKFKYNANLPPPTKYPMEEYRNEYQGNHNFRFYDNNKHHSNRPYRRISNIHNFELNSPNNNAEWNFNNPITVNHAVFYQQTMKQPSNYQDVRYENSQVRKDNEYIISSDDFNYEYSQRDTSVPNFGEKSRGDDNLFFDNGDKVLEKPTLTYQVTIKTCNYDNNPKIHYNQNNYNQTMNQFQNNYKTTIEHKNFDHQQKNESNNFQKKYCRNSNQSEIVKKIDNKEEDNKQIKKPVPILGRRIEVAELFGNNYCGQTSPSSNITTNIYNANVSTTNSDVKVQISVIGGQKTPTSPSVSNSKGNKRHLLNQSSFRNEVNPSGSNNKVQNLNENISVKLNTEDEQIPEDPCVKKDSNNKLTDNQRKRTKNKEDFNISNNDESKKDNKNDIKKDDQKSTLFMGKPHNRNRFYNSKTKFNNSQKSNIKK
ncbi:ATP-dependent RNA helicase DHX29 [Strongyloides ratti]|uniref:ATP-dependent RNA helicase DHX29 n=1 Tax=Strongyloides ratti TaxID=34506 RepID=A0A090LDP6_STRRB|nr:ATP-dependent RNA helicase DHX29 [Strongyloides ratti]CEF67887.1 ATP-dependent RNA helicase DHX29 [Strongyloides ratti]